MPPPSQPCDPTSQNVKAFLKLLRWLENYPRDDDGVYLVMFGGSTFTDTTKHPNIANSRWNRTSTAAGAYMFVFGTWKEAVDKKVITDFTPASQDTLAWWKIGRRNAQVAVCGGRNTLSDAFSLLSSEWASLPGASQSQVKESEARNKYESYLLQFAPAASSPAPAAPGQEK